MQDFSTYCEVDENIPSPQEKGDREAVEEVLAGRGIAPEIIIRGETPLPPSLRSALPGMPLASRANAPPEGKVK